MTDHEFTAAADAITYRLRNREPGTDDEVFARELITMLQGRGWRPTAAKPQPPWNQQRQGPGDDTYREGLAAAREQLAAEEVHAGAVLPSGISFGPHRVSRCRIDLCGRRAGQLDGAA